jgi:C4-dicarboxylate-specific signal transduction histidine kinase
MLPPPLYDAVSNSSPIIGATVMRLDVDRVDTTLKSWPGPALLLSPQQITFASNRSEWIERMAQTTTPEQIKAITALKQFGNTFEAGSPKTLPFDLTGKTVGFDNRRYAVSRAPVQWNDPNGEWTLVLLSDLDQLMPIASRIKIGLAISALVLLLCAVFLVWRQRLGQANLERLRAETEVKSYTVSWNSSLKPRPTSQTFQRTCIEPAHCRISPENSCFTRCRRWRLTLACSMYTIGKICSWFRRGATAYRAMALRRWL